MDDTDRRLIALLRQDARLSVATLATKLGVSRGTVTNRLRKLEDDQVIVGYTVRLKPDAEPNHIRAWMGVLVEGSRRIPLVVRGDESLRADPARFADLTLVSPLGGPVRIGDIARIRRVDGPVKVDREAGSRYALVQANVSGRDLVGFVEEARQAVADDIPLPPGYSLGWGGQFENQQRAAGRLMLVVPVALFLIAFILFLTFGSLKQTLLILSNIPFALTGGLIALWATGAAIAQLFGTNLLIMAFGHRNFVVGTAFSKTEAVQASIFAWIVLGEHLGPAVIAGIVAGVTGVACDP